MKFELGQKVIADGGDIKMTVTGICLYTRGYSYECAWFNNGSYILAWFDEWRLEIAK